MRYLGTIVLALAVTSAACGGGEQKPARTASEPAAGKAVLPASNTSGAEFGVKECDDYLAKYTECVSSKVPEAVRTAMTAALDQSKAQWKALATTPEGRAGLVQACTQAHDAAKASMQAYGCSW